MSWRHWLKGSLRLWRHGPNGGSAEALQSAEVSYRRAVADRSRAAIARVEAEIVEAQVREHNRANRFDDWLQSVINGGA